jgi:Flp pilus assembly protein TadB
VGAVVVVVVLLAGTAGCTVVLVVVASAGAGAGMTVVVLAGGFTVVWVQAENRAMAAPRIEGMRNFFMMWFRVISG